jgi:hypothetical protein
VKCRPTQFRHVVLAAVAAVAGFAGLAVGSGPGVAVTATASDVPPILTGMTYLNGPFARVGWVAQPVARIELSGPAPSPITVSTLSSEPAVALVPGEVVVPTGESSALVPVTGLSEGFVTLSATLGTSTASPAQSLEVAGATRLPALQDVTVEPASVVPGGTATVRAALDFLAPPGGTELAITAAPSNAAVLPATVTVPTDEYAVSFPVQDTGQTSQFNVTVTLGAKSISVPIAVVQPPVNPPPVVDTTPPDTRISDVRLQRAKRKATFRFTSTESGSTFVCRVDDKAFRLCTSPWTSGRLKPGRHVFAVQARDATGNLDTSPAQQRFRIKR